MAINNLSNTQGRGMSNEINTGFPQKFIEIQLLYNVNQATETNLWDGNFLPISLYDTLKHLLFDSKNIKESLKQITNYIKNKSINCNKLNDIPDLKRMGEVVWNFILTIYDSEWDSLVSLFFFFWVNNLLHRAQ